MPAPTVTVVIPPPVTYSDAYPRPETRVTWSGATGPTVDVLHEWDTDNSFPSPISDLNAGVAFDASHDVGVPPADLTVGTWHYRVTVTDNADAAATTSGFVTLEVLDSTLLRRYLYEELNDGVGFDDNDRPAGGWDPEATGDPLIGPGDGYANLFRRYLYEEFGDVNTDTPTPHIWYLFPTFGREGWEFRIVGYGFGDTQPTYGGSATLNGLAVDVLSWELVAETSPDLTIDPINNTAEPIHQLIRAAVPQGAESGLVIVCTDGP